ncbi:unnamed protein product [Protopolystoma xenopodis]|uniref:Uncharacterized protein n=1 Tax=Protopolystoma xenopodis TaxID=117903 RepID=A0A448WWU0_9PLAT|nr:unnamed protein product [Protopolystoma xenopodis]
MLRPDSSASGPVEGCIGTGGGSGDLGSPGTGKPPVRPFGGKEEEVGHAVDLIPTLNLLEPGCLRGHSFG